MTYDVILKRLEEIREYEWNNYDIKIFAEEYGRKGVKKGENALQAIARNIVEALDEVPI